MQNSELQSWNKNTKINRKHNHLYLALLVLYNDIPLTVSTERKNAHQLQQNTSSLQNTTNRN